MKRVIVLLAILLQVSITNCQTNQNGFPVLKGTYLGQNEPGMNTELFAPGIVSSKGGVHGNIVFTSDFSEAAWHPNYEVNGRSLIYIMKS